MPNRVFFAIWPLGQAGRAIAARAARAEVRGKAVPAARLHLTLAFHGCRDPAAIDALIRRADAIEAQAFDLVIDRLGCFARAGVVWAGPRAVPAALSSLAAALAPGPGRGIDNPRFRPHITVRRQSRCPATTVFPALRLPARSFALVASGEDGAPGAYRTIARWPLR